jgi:hypothetical protein
VNEKIPLMIHKISRRKKQQENLEWEMGIGKYPVHEPYLLFLMASIKRYFVHET